jgi:ubiquinone/menaquinone biosynthesis C-methylase UbiE
VPDADVREGDFQALAWPDGTFDVVTGFNSFFYAESLEQALREAHRVARPGARLAMTAFGRPEPGDFAPLVRPDGTVSLTDEYRLLLAPA